MKNLNFLHLCTAAAVLCGLLPCSLAAQTQVVAGENHAIVKTQQNSLWAWGGNAGGQLGIGNTLNRLEPTLVGVDMDWAAISAARNTTLAVKTDGTLWSWGNGQTTPLQIGTSNQWDKVAAGDGFNLALRKDGTLYGWGANLGARLMTLPDVTTQPTLMAANMRFRAIAAGVNHALAIATDGRLYSWGTGAAGQLGIGDVGFQAQRSTPQAVGPATDWVAVAASALSSFAINSAGELYAWGSNDNGRLGVGAPPLTGPWDVLSPRKVNGSWSAVSAGPNHTAGLATNGSAWVWGNSTGGRLGLDVPSGSFVYHPTQVLPGQTFSSVAAGGDFSLLLATDGVVYSTGANGSGQLGNGSTLAANTFVASFFGIADLIVPQVRVLSPAPAIGIPLLVEVELRNQGTGTVPAGAGLEVAFFLSQEPVLDETAIRIQSVSPAQLSESMAGGVSLVRTFTLNLANDTPGGAYHLFAVVNPSAAIPESDLTNNSNKAEVVLSFRPDLTATVNHTQGLTVIRGELFQVDITVRNLGNMPVAAGVQGQLLARPVSAGIDSFNVDPVVIGSFTVSSPLGADATVQMSNASFVWPAVLNPAEYHLGVFIDSAEVIDESREDNNRRFNEQRRVNMVRTAANPDLRAGLQITARDFNPPVLPGAIPLAIGGNGQWYARNFQSAGAVAFIPDNAGTLPAGSEAWFELVIPGPFLIQFSWELESDGDSLIFTIDGVEPSGDNLVTSIQGSQPQLNFEMVVESFVAPRRLRWTYLRGNGGAPDFGFVRNLQLNGVNLPDLIVTQLEYNREGQQVFVMGRHDSFLDVLVAGINVGKDIPVGPFPGNNTFDIEVRLSKDRIWGNEDDVMLGTLQEIRGIGGGDGFLFAQMFDLTPDNYGCIPEGDYYMAVLVDPTNRIQEFNENNNLRFSDQPDVRIEWRPQIYLAEGLREGENDVLTAEELRSVRYRPGMYYRLGDLQVEFDLRNIGCGDLLPGEVFEMRIDLKGATLDRKINEGSGLLEYTLSAPIGVLTRELAVLRYDRGLPAGESMRIASSLQLPIYNEEAVWTLVTEQSFATGWIPPIHAPFDLDVKDETIPVGLFDPEDGYFNSPRNHFFVERNPLLFGLELQFSAAPGGRQFMYDALAVRLTHDIMIQKTPLRQTYQQWADHWSLWVNQADFFRYYQMMYPSADWVRAVGGPLENQDIIYLFDPITGARAGFIERPDNYTNFAEYALGLNPHRPEPFPFDRDGDRIIITPTGAPTSGFGAGGVVLDVSDDSDGARYLALTFNALSHYSNGGVRYLVQASTTPDFSSGVVDLLVYEPLRNNQSIAAGKDVLRTFSPAGSTRPSLVSLVDNHYLYRLTVRDTVPMNAVSARFLRVVVEPVGQ